MASTCWRRSRATATSCMEPARWDCKTPRWPATTAPATSRSSISTRAGWRSRARSASIDEVHHAAPRGFDVVIEATGRTKVAELAINGVIRGGKLLIFGVCPPGEKAAYDAFKIFNDEISIIGSMAVSRSYGPAISVIKAGALHTKRTVSHSFPMDRFDEAVATMRAGVGLKIQVDPRA